ncbi:HlyU family transcriptional regulator [Shimia abyssi]|uniref:Transcriptional activator HlyU n=1 Tax=Shimia abyssi TaxID=1662395 RepID=A0A2P8FE71_9RHOB|nr:HlyU family transcriptional regulator [Shimia abyssi]PSL20019.1 hypothetical protein CLV88_10478 [Shimia abyssi]
MSFLKKLFGGTGGGGESAQAAEPVDYKGFAIYPEPIKEGGVFRVSARIEKNIDGELRSQRLVRADTVNVKDDAMQAGVTKSKQVIDEQGDRLFDGPNA